MTSVRCPRGGKPRLSDVISSPHVSSDRCLNRLWYPAPASLLRRQLPGCFCCPPPQGPCFRACQRDSCSVHSGRWRPVSGWTACLPQHVFGCCCCNTFAMGLPHPSGRGEAKGTQGQMGKMGSPSFCISFLPDQQHNPVCCPISSSRLGSWCQQYAWDFQASPTRKAAWTLCSSLLWERRGCMVLCQHR